MKNQLKVYVNSNYLDGEVAQVIDDSVHLSTENWAYFGFGYALLGYSQSIAKL